MGISMVPKKRLGPFFPSGMSNPQFRRVARKQYHLHFHSVGCQLSRNGTELSAYAQTHRPGFRLKTRCSALKADNPGPRRSPCISSHGEKERAIGGVCGGHLHRPSNSHRAMEEGTDSHRPRGDYVDLRQANLLPHQAWFPPLLPDRLIHQIRPEADSELATFPGCLSLNASNCPTK